RVNIAARLMSRAAWSEVLVDEEVRKDRHYKFRHRGDFQYKGLKRSIPTYQLLGREEDTRLSFDGQMVGREEELRRLLHFAREVFRARRPGLAYLFGEAGMGKTRLAFELREALGKDFAFNWHTCQSDQILRKPFNPFLHFLKNYFLQSADYSEHQNRQWFDHRFKELVNHWRRSRHPRAPQILQELLRTHSVLAALLKLHTPNSLWETLDGRGRYENTIQAIANLLIAEALQQPLVLELEDGHWFDDSSRHLLEHLLDQAQDLPLLLLVTSRYDDQGHKPYLLDLEKRGATAPPLLELELHYWDKATLVRYAEDRLGGALSPELQELLHRTTGGNPFYTEQILEYFKESELLSREGHFWCIKDPNVRLSNSIQTVLTARIDRLSTNVKETVKAAAVIGREFEVPILSEVMTAQKALTGANGSAEAPLREQIEQAERVQIWMAQNELRYIFKHSLLREAVYEMQMRTRLRQLHQLIAQAIEKIYAQDLESRYADLAFHYSQAENREKALEYLEKAAGYAIRNYQNGEALGFLDQLLELLNAEEEAPIAGRALLQKGQVLELVGSWEEARRAYSQAFERARKLGDPLLLGRCHNSLGHLLMLQGSYEEARTHFEKAATLFQSNNDKRGMAVVSGNLGDLFFRQGHYKDAQLQFVKSLQLFQLFGHAPATAPIVANLGLTYMNLGKYEDGIRWQQSHLEICRKENDRIGMATLYTHLGIVYFEKGDYDNALECYRQGLELSTQLGNKLLTAIALGSIGSVYQKKGDFAKAMDLFEQDLRLTRELGDKQGVAISLQLIGELHSAQGKFDEAAEAMQQALALSRQLNYRKGIAKALNALGDLYFYQKDYATSLKYYDQAIDVTRLIGNKLVLGFSLLEKANVLLHLNELESARRLLSEAEAIARQLGNPDLLFELETLSARLLARQGRSREARQALQHLLDEARNPKESAALHYFLFQAGAGDHHRREALQRYQTLYQETPDFLYRLRIEELSSAS
ncbi:MAG: tetratricopeptide repeat protein, partial [Bacteroidetes bacterium]